MNMKANLGVYSIEAYKVLRQAVNWYLNTVFSQHVLCIEANNEVVFMEDVESDPAIARRRLTNVLRDYVNGNQMILRAPADEERVKAICLISILLGEDSEAKAAFPSVYDELKGKPLNPFQIESVAILTNEVAETERKIDKVLMNGGLAHCEEMRDLEMEKDKLLKRIGQIRGMNDKDRVELCSFNGVSVMELVSTRGY